MCPNVAVAQLCLCLGHVGVCVCVCMCVCVQHLQGFSSGVESEIIMSVRERSPPRKNPVRKFEEREQKGPFCARVAIYFRKTLILRNCGNHLFPEKGHLFANCGDRLFPALHALLDELRANDQTAECRDPHTHTPRYTGAGHEEQNLSLLFF